MDALVVAAALASLYLSNDPTASPSAKKVVKILKLLRVLRPLKSVNKSKKLKAVFQCMIYSVKNVINILAITIMLLFAFSSMGVQLFVGRFFYCTDRTKMTKETCQGRFIDFPTQNYFAPVEKDRVWKKQPWNFDAIGNAMVTLFTSATGEGWPSVMFNAIDATDYDRGPMYNNQPRMGLYFFFFQVIMAFFFLQIFVALIILTFQVNIN